MPSAASAAADQALYNQNASMTGVNSTSRNKLAKDMNTFVTLLTSQLKNQDPLSPMDSSEFTNQLVQFAQVEQQIAQNEKLDSMISLNKQGQAATAVQYLGMDVEAESGLLPVQDGEGRFAYGLTKDAKTVGIMIQDSDGKTVFTKIGETTAGVHEVNWDGKDKDGNQLEDGTYRISVTALDGDGASIDTWTTVFGTVDGITTQDGDTILTMGKVGVKLDNVLSVSPKGSQVSSSDVNTDEGEVDDGSPDEHSNGETSGDGGTSDNTNQDQTA